MPGVSMRQMLEAGVHFGHQTRFWNPKMAPLSSVSETRSTLLTSRRRSRCTRRRRASSRASSPMAARCCSWAPSARRASRSRRQAARSAQPYVSQRWLGGMPSRTSRPSASRSSSLTEITELAASGALEKRGEEGGHAAAPRDGQARAGAGRHQGHGLAPGRAVRGRRGARNIAIAEAEKLGIPVVAIVDTNCAPDGIDYVIPGNDDAMRAIQLYATGIADAVLEGQEVRAAGRRRRRRVRRARQEAGNPRRKSPRGRLAAPPGGGTKKAPARRRVPAVAQVPQARRRKARRRRPQARRSRQSWPAWATAGRTPSGSGRGASQGTHPR